MSLHLEAGAFSRALRPLTRERVRGHLGLSNREMDVAVGMAEGLTNDALAERLRCSVHTVGTHVRRIFRKLEVSNRAAVVGRLLLVYHDLIDVDGSAPPTLEPGIRDQEG